MIDRIPIKKDPKLFDVAIQELQKHLGNKISWLNHVFGKSEQLTKEINDREYLLPYVYIGNGEYIGVAPDSHLGNFCFFELEDPNIVKVDIIDRPTIESNINLILWCDLRTFQKNDNRNTEYVKQIILRVLNSAVLTPYGRVVINKIYERKENVFGRYDLNVLDNQFCMYPFCALKFNLNLIIKDSCI